MRLKIFICLALAGMTLAVYWPATRCDFINYDDPDYVTANPHVLGGLRWEGVKWAFYNTEQAAYWAPLTWLSHMFACQFFGLDAWGHHLINVLLHAANTALVFLVFQRMTRATWRSLILAALFGWHPLRVESVAWVTERKDVLSTFFGLLTLYFYVRHVQKPEVRSRKSETNLPTASFFPPSPFYWLSLFFFALGLMSKAMLVTIPCVLLLLDYWPLRRISEFGVRPSSAVALLRRAESSELKSGPQPSTPGSLAPRSAAKTAQLSTLVLEKWPFFALAAAASVVTFVVQKQGGTLMTVESLPLGARVENALISYCRYLGKLFWPTDLAVYYPHPASWPLEKVLLAGVFLCGISVLLFVKRGRYPFLLMGWLWFVGTLVPVIQLVQSGGQAMADRFTYIPSLGILILAIWGAYELARRWRYHVIALSAAGSVAVILCIGLTRQQLGYWQDSEALFRHTLEVTENNPIAYRSLGDALFDKGQTDEAISQYQEAIRLRPNYVEAHNNLGIALAKNHQIDAAISQYREVIQLRPDSAKALYNLGVALAAKGQSDEAISQFQEAIRLRPDYAEARYNLGVALAAKGQSDEAISQFQEVVRLRPDYAEAHNNLGIALAKKHQINEAMSQFQEAIRLEPDYAEAHYNLGNALLIKGQTAEAINQYQEALRLKPDYAAAQKNLNLAKALELKKFSSAEQPEPPAIVPTLGQH